MSKNDCKNINKVSGTLLFREDSYNHEIREPERSLETSDSGLLCMTDEANETPHG